MKLHNDYEQYYDDIYPTLLKKPTSFYGRFLSLIRWLWLSL
ncbi:MAG: hypothetical protein ACYSWS_02075 [Planctomycetota bacterium]